MNNQLHDLIISKGHYRVLFRPVGEVDTLGLGEALQVVKDNEVSLRGWPFPFVSTNFGDNRGIDTLDNGVRGWIDSDNEKEFWTMFLSSQFISLSALNEDFYTPGQLREYFGNDAIRDGGCISFVGSITYYVSEIYEFLSRLVASGLYVNGVEVTISLINTEGRLLVGQNRYLSTQKIASSNEIKFKRVYSVSQLSTGHKAEAVNCIRYILERFNWIDVSTELLETDQQKLYSREF